MNVARTSILSVAAIMSATSAMATDYAIRFDLGSDHLSSTSGPDMNGSMFGWFRWRSVGWNKGGLFKNKSGKEIRAVHIKVTHPRTPQNPGGDLLAISSDPHDDLFDTIWVKDDHTEVIFSSSKGKIGDSDVIWNKVTQSTAKEIEKCQNNGEEICPLAGKLFENPQKPPSGEQWTQIKGPHDAKSWKPLAALPPRFRRVDVYGISDDEKYVVFVSKNRVLAYDSGADRAFYIDDPSLEPDGINRIAYENGQFVLYRSGVAGSRFTPGKWKITKFEETN